MKKIIGSLLLLYLLPVWPTNANLQCSSDICNRKGVCNAVSSSLSVVSHSQPQKYFISFPKLTYVDANRYCIRRGGNLISMFDIVGLKETRAFLKGFNPTELLQNISITATWLQKPALGDCYTFPIDQMQPLVNECNDHFVALCRSNTRPNIVMEGKPSLGNSSCQCKAGFGYHHCREIDNSASYSFCYGPLTNVNMGKANGENIVYVDHAVFGKPYRLKNTPISNKQCLDSLYTNDESQVCITGNTLSLMKYWCQGKPTCSFQTNVLDPFSYKSDIFFPDELAVTYYDAFKICRMHGGFVYGVSGASENLSLISEHLLVNTNAYGAWLYPSNVDLLTEKDGPNICKILINKKYAIGIRTKLNDEYDVYEWPCSKERISFETIIPVCQRTKPQFNPNVNYNCLQKLDSQKILEFRYHMEPDLNKKDIDCPPNTFYRRSNTCFKKTDKLDWNKARLQCWHWGGELAFPFPEGEQCSAPIIREETEALWIAGSSRQTPRPILPLHSPFFEEGTYESSNDLCFPELNRDPWCSLIGQCLVEKRGLCALPPISKYNKPSVKPNSDKKCPEVKAQMVPEWPYSDYEWNIEGTADSVYVQKCPHGQEGNVYWKCGANGEWEGYPDFSQCYFLDFNEAYNSLEMGNSVLPTKVLDGVYSQVHAVNNLATGDMESVMRILEKAIKKQKHHMSNEDSLNDQDRYTQASLRLIDDILTKSITWFGLPPKKTEINLNRIQANVEEFSEMFLTHTASLNSLYNYTTIVLSVSKLTNKNATYTFDALGSSQIFVTPSVSSNMNVIFQAFPHFNCIINKKYDCNDPDPLGKSLVYGTVIGATLFDENKKRTHRISGMKVELIFKNDRTDKLKATNPQCVYWSSRSLGWSSSGCKLVKFTPEETHCECDHLTNFAVLMDFNSVLEDKDDVNEILDYITLVGGSLSIASLLVCLFVFFVILRNTGERVIIHQNLCICLLLAEIILLSGLDSAKEGKLICTCITAALHFLFLSAFFWMLLEGINIYLKLVKVFDSGLPHISVYYLTGYGFSSVIVLCSVLGVNFLSTEGYTAESFCWLNAKNGAIWLFNGPALIIIIVNGCFFVMALKIARNSIFRRNDRSHVKNTMLYFRGSTSLLCVLGLTWVFGFAFFSEGFVWVAYIFAVLNSLQGVFILIFHVFMNEKARHDTKRFFRKNYYIQRWWLDQSTFSGHDSSSREKTTAVKEMSTQEISTLSNKSSKF